MEIKNDLTLSRVIRDFVIILSILTPMAAASGWWFGYGCGKEKGKNFVRSQAAKNGFGEFFIVDSLTGQKDFRWK